jgi:hypothetical protein
MWRCPNGNSVFPIFRVRKGNGSRKSGAVGLVDLRRMGFAQELRSVCKCWWRAGASRRQNLYPVLLAASFEYEAKKMRWVFGLIGTLFTFSAGAAPPVCDQFQKERRLVNELYAELAYVESMQAGPGWSFRAPAMESILDVPLGSACWLVRELVVTHRTELDPMQSLLSHPVWAIRTLRYITNCGDFRTTLPEKE